MARSTKRGNSTLRHLIEWIVGALGAAIVLGSISYLAYKGITNNDAPPDIDVHIAAIRPVNGGYLVRLRIQNDGATSAAQLRVRGTLLEDNRSIETSEATFDYAPPQSMREGGLFFSNDPRQFELRISAEGYEKP